MHDEMIDSKSVSEMSIYIQCESKKSSPP